MASNVPIGSMIVPAGDERRPKLTDFVNLLLFVHEKLSSIKSNILLPFFNCNDILLISKVQI